MVLTSFTALLFSVQPVQNRFQDIVEVSQKLLECKYLKISQKGNLC